MTVDPLDSMERRAADCADALAANRYVRIAIADLEALVQAAEDVLAQTVEYAGLVDAVWENAGR